MVSVIIPSFNSESSIRDALNSILDQGIEDLEIITVDDGSFDHTPNIIKEEFSFVKLLRTERKGPGSARNVGTKASRGEFIQYLDADDLLAPGKIEKQLNALKESGMDIAYGDWQRVKKDKDIYVYGDKVSKKLNNPEVDLLTDFWSPPAAYLFRRSIVEKSGGWNEEMPLIEDVRFLLDCARSGAKFVYCEGVMAYYREPSPSSLSQQDPIEFVRCCLRNAIDMERWWRQGRGIDKTHKDALLKAYGYVARASFERDKPTFETAYEALKRINPNYVPPHPKHLAFASRMFGYKNAELLGSWYRRAKRFI